MDIELYKRTLKAKKMTYEDLSKSTGLSLGCIKRIMAGIAQFPRIDTIEAIENALEISNGITQEERNAGWTNVKKVTISPDEDDLLYYFREIGRLYGKEMQKVQLTNMKNLIEVKK